MPADWMDSDEAVAAIAAVGYQAPGPSETYTKVSMKVNMETLLDQCTDPVWEIEKITAEPGEDVVSERWFALFCTSADTKLGCNPAGECSAVP